MKPYANIRLTRRERQILAIRIRLNRKHNKQRFTRKDAHDLAFILFA
jgi:hypothetical protein